MNYMAASLCMKSCEDHSLLKAIMEVYGKQLHVWALNTSFYIRKTPKGFQKIMYSLRCDMMTSFEHYIVVTS